MLAWLVRGFLCHIRDFAMIALVEAVEDVAGLTPENAWEEVGEVVVNTARAFAHKYRQHEDDMVADASMAFMKGVAAINAGKSNADDIRVEIRRWVWFELFDEYRTRTRHRHKNKAVIEGGDAVNLVADNRRRSPLADLYDELGPDALHTVGLILDPPEEIARIARAKGGTECNLRSTVRQHLTANGWGRDRINAAFDEIRAALC
jgi:hypothetical protein